MSGPCSSNLWYALAKVTFIFHVHEVTEGITALTDFESLVFAPVVPISFDNFHEDETAKCLLY